MYDMRMLFVFTRDIVSCRFGTEELACFARRVDSEWRELVLDVSKSYHLQFVVETFPKHTEDHKAGISIVFAAYILALQMLRTANSISLVVKF